MLCLYAALVSQSDTYRHKRVTKVYNGGVPKKSKPARNPDETCSIHARLPVNEIARLDALARENNITRGAVIAIACARILKTGL